MNRLGLPLGIHACLFKLEGVLTKTATLRAKAWQKTFGGFLSDRARSSGQPFVPFNAATYRLTRGTGPLQVLHHGEALTLTNSSRIERLIPPSVPRAPPAQPPGREPRCRSSGGLLQKNET
jgi:hypothetical protein